MSLTLSWVHCDEEIIQTLLVGFGINIAHNASTCIKDLFKDLTPNREVILAKIINELRSLVYEPFPYEEYHRVWLHSNQKVIMESTNVHGRVVGINKEGFLQVECDDGEMRSYAPDVHSLAYGTGTINRK